MAVFFPSRHLFTEEVYITVPETETSDVAGLEVRVRTDREPFRFRPFVDNIVHTVRDGETLWTLAALYFQGFVRPSGLWWIIADYQPDPIFDPTIRLTKGTTLFIPSMRVVNELIFSDTRIEETAS
jgi:hypothetical protein